MIGKVFRISIFGESHGKGIGVMIEGCPPGIKLEEKDLMVELAKRRIDDSNISTQRKEEDVLDILSGIFRGYTTGAPITIFISNKDIDSSRYEAIKDTPRPRHADYTARIKYFGYNDYRGGGIFSGRITAAIVAAGAIAKKVLGRYGIEVYAYIRSVGDITVPNNIPLSKIKEETYKSPVRCADPETSKVIYELIKQVRLEGDSIGGVVEAIGINIPPGLGEPPIDTLEGDISKAIFAIPGVKGIEFGKGFEITKLKGSEANDPFIITEGRIVTEKNDSGGINGGISNGMPIVFRVAFKPTPSIYKPQRTVDISKMMETEIELSGRFDPCIAIRAVPVVENMFATVLADHLLRWLSWVEFMS